MQMAPLPGDTLVSSLPAVSLLVKPGDSLGPSLATTGSAREEQSLGGTSTLLMGDPGSTDRLGTLGAAKLSAAGAKGVEPRAERLAATNTTQRLGVTAGNLQGTQLEALDLLKSVASKASVHGAPKSSASSTLASGTLVGSFSMQGTSHLVTPSAADEDLDVAAIVTQRRLEGGGGIVADLTQGLALTSAEEVGVGPIEPVACERTARPTPLAEELYDDDDDEDDGAEGTKRIGIACPSGVIRAASPVGSCTPLSDASAWGASVARPSSSLEYSYSVSGISPSAFRVGSADITAASERGSGHDALRPPKSLQQLDSLNESLCSLSLTKTVDAAMNDPLGGATLSFSDTGCSQVLTMAASHTASGAGAVGAGIPEDRCVGSIARAAIVAGSPAGSPPVGSAAERSPAASTTAGSPTVMVGKGQLEAFASAVQGAKGLGKDLQGDLLSLLQSMPSTS
mmetsp:Transcript_37264/g.98195  ORF Transcript_37264/g.98195 Transcript_37264/m.98195 type:complete len:455 (-) Transcript_37264:156-1520(-)